MQASQQHGLQSKANNTCLLQLQIFGLSIGLVSSLLTVPSRLAPSTWPGQMRNRETKQTVNHRNIHLSRRQHMHFFGACTNVGPYYKKLYAQVTHIWANRKGQPNSSAMKGPRLERTPSLITVPPASGKYENSWHGHQSNPNLLTSISLW